MKVKIFLSALFFIFVFQVSWAQIPNTISYQGVLKNADGTLVSDGSYSLTINFYESETGGTAVWSEARSVSVTDGIFNVILGEVTSLDISFDKQYWLGITIGGGSELTPRSELTSVPYSLNTKSIPDSIVTESKIVSGAVTPVKINTSGAGSGQSLIFDGSNLAWGTPSGAGDGHSLDAADGSPTDAVYVDNDGNLVLEGATADGYETTIAVTDPTADRTLTLPDAAGTVLVSGTAAIADLSDGSTSGGSGNLFIGTSSGDAIQLGGRENTGLGYQSLKSTTTGGYNTASGYQALYKNNTGYNNTASGYRALYSNTTGWYNTAVGYLSLYNANRTADVNAYNTAVGSWAGDIITTGKRNVIIGAKSDPSANTAVNQIVIGYYATGTGDNQIALGNTSITAIKGQVNFTTYSDRRIKRDIQDGDLGLAFINELRTVKYKRRNPADYPEPLLEERFRTGQDERPQDDETVYDGLISQEVKSTLDNLGLKWSGWTEDENTGKQGIQYGALVVPLIKAVQELSAKVEELKRKLNNLEKTDFANSK